MLENVQAEHFWFRARFDLIESDRRSKLFYFKHNLIDPRFTPVGLCSKFNH
jgi:hypothetical protein